MFKIAIPKEFTRADGRPFRKQTEDKDGRPIPIMEDGHQRTIGGIPQFETERANYIDMMSLFLNNIFDVVAIKAKDNKEIKRLQFEDSSNATDVFRAIHVATDGVFELEKAPYEWLQKMVTEWGAEVFGVNAAVILEPLKKAEEIVPTRAEARREKK